MLPDLQYAAIRFENFVSQVLLPAAMPRRVPLAASVWQTPERVSPAVAFEREFAPVEPGWRWGPVWSSAWFRLRGALPAEMEGKRVALRFSSGTEALLWKDGVPFQGFDPYRELAFLWDRAPGGAPVDLLIEAACNLPLGISTFWWDHPELHARWKERNPGRLEAAELVEVDEAIWRFAQGFDAARKVLLTLPETDARAHELDRGLRALMARLPVGRPSGAWQLHQHAPGSASQHAPQSAARRTAPNTAPSSAEDTAPHTPQHPALHAACTMLLPELAALLMGRGAQTPVVCNAVGHAHIDTAWLWPLAETRRKCLRTFANVLRLQERFPRFQFLCSQAQQYAWVEEESPELFAQIAARVAEGRWEAGGAMWIEPDCTCPSGESFIRQILHGTQWWQDRFGSAAPQRFLYLPDTFGFPASLPQIMALAGLDTFITNKMSWCESNRFPHVTFRWRGIDGTEILTHLTPGHNYNSSIEPKDFQYAVENLVRQDAARIPLYLQPYGYGDGGGGPTAEQIERAGIGARCEGLPRVEQTRVDEFCGQLHTAQRALWRAGQDIRVWDGELYLELHRGTYTSQAWIKEANRRGEVALRLAEALACARAGFEGAEIAAQMRIALDGTWKLLLLNQFHDILPGSSIAEVYADARVQMDQVRADALRGVQQGMEWLARAAQAAREADASEGTQVASEGSGAALAAQASAQSVSDGTEALVVFNPASTAQSGVMATEEGEVLAVRVPPLGIAVIDPARAPVPEARDAAAVEGDRTLRNGFLEAVIDDAGRIASLRRAGDARVANGFDHHQEQLPMNQLVLYEDRPRRWEAWDIDRDYQEQAQRVMTRAERISVRQHGPLVAEIAVERPLGRASHMVQRYRLVAGSPRLDIVTDIDWREEQMLLRALFPCAVRTRRATFGIQFGCFERATHDNTSWERAQFEVPGHNWMDLSEPGLGIAVLDDGKFGRSARHGVLGLSLLRAPNFPDPGADRGTHRFTYSVMVHEGDWRAAGVDAQAEQLNNPLIGAIARGARVQGAHAPGAAAAAPGGGPPSDSRPGIATGWQAIDLRTTGAAHMEVAALKPAEEPGGVTLRAVEVRGGAGLATLRWGFPVREVIATDLHERPLDLPGLVHDAATGVTCFPARPFQIVTLRAELVR